MKDDGIPWVLTEMSTGSSNLRVLVIDHYEGVAEFHRQLLTANGYDCETAFCVESGLAAAKRFLPDVILFGLVMPGDGRLLPSLLGRDSAPTLIVLSGDVCPETEKQLRADGVEYVLTKPVPGKLLLSILRGCSPRPLQSRKPELERKSE
jgi:DNA-binding response OmpR family regulator